MTISLIVAMDQNRVIGLNNRTPWRLPADMKYFKKTTMGKPIIMGRKTYESIGRPLPGRKNIVVTSSRHYKAEGCTVVHSIEDALSAAGEGEVMVIGGARLYEQLLPVADRLYVTLLEKQFEGDTYFPEIDEGDWLEIAREDIEPGEDVPFRYSFIVLERRN
jgi:dihydrofolate reductase